MLNKCLLKDFIKKKYYTLSSFCILENKSQGWERDEDKRKGNHKIRSTHTAYTILEHIKPLIYHKMVFRDGSLLEKMYTDIYTFSFKTESH